ncbi:Uu.00g084830.m01.CDS01 [Anthostomella pinea]|uniref:Uu.00g084830.m01.CDS01 n=1 Tax=Anthostomella pinea TaxID=933095 RepID=A0AAI8VMG6_9PEZI|nr:Uu.00g084830.m01.CDS01 [Anthostomella pinea]
MLQLGSRNARRLGASYICATCLARPRPSFAHRAAIIPSHHGRPFSTTIPRRAEAITEDPAPSDKAADKVAEPQPPSKKPPPKKGKKSKKSKPKAPAGSGANQNNLRAAKPKNPPTTTPETDAQRQIQVLQGALASLKKVLAAQNIDIGKTGKPSQETAATPSTKPGTKKKSKSKPKKGNAEETSTPTAEKEDGQTSTEGQPAKPTAGNIVRLVKSRNKASKSKARTPRSKEVVPASPSGHEVEQAQAAPSKNPFPGEPYDFNTKSSPFSTAKEQCTKGPPEIRKIAGKQIKGENASKAASRYMGKPFSGELPPPDILNDLDSEARPVRKHGRESKTRPGRLSLKISTINPKATALVPMSTEQPAVPTLTYGLERVLFNPGVYQLQDPRSRVYNFDPYLSQIMPIQEFDFNALKQYVTSSKDTTLISIAKENEKKYTGSTSSMTSMLSHFHYLLSSWRDISTNMLSRNFEPDSKRFTQIMRAPAAIFLHWKNGTYAIDADKEFDTANILSMLGKSMEKLLTLSKEDYEKYRHVNSDQITEEERNAEEAYHYTGFGDFMMRSQLDAYDPRVPGTGMFDLKTRAVVSIRMDAKGYQKGLGYEIRNRFGQWESFEREYYDMIRSAFLKYSLQVRMGRMDGIFVAFHNTQRIFGFQYIPLSEMDESLHGTSNTTLGDREFKLSLRLLNDLLNRATKKFPEQSLRLHFETRTSTTAPFMYVFAKPVQPGEIEQVQSAGKASVEAFERDILGMSKDVTETQSGPVAQNDEAIEEDIEEEEDPAAEEMTTFAAWEEARQMVEDAMDDDELGVGTVREAIEDALEQSGILRARSSTEAREYVDALLGAITGKAPSDLADSPSVLAVEEDAHEDASENDHEPGDSTSTNIDEPLQSTELHSEEPLRVSEDVQVDASKGLEGSPDTPASAHEESSESSPESRQAATESSEQAQVEATHKLGTLKEEHDDGSFGTRGSLSPGETVMDQTSTSATREMEEKVEEEEEEEEEGDDLEDGGSKGETSPADMSHLRDLILRMAQRIDERVVSKRDGIDELDDSSKLRAFERILGDLISRSRVNVVEQGSIESTPEANTRSKTNSNDEVEQADAQLIDKPNTQDKQPAATTQGDAGARDQPVEEDLEQGELLGMVLTVKNKVNGKYEDRPERLTKRDEWLVQYNIEEIPDERARKIYSQVQERRRKTFEDTGDKEKEWYKMFRGQLDERTQRGRRFRAKESKNAAGRPVHVVDQDMPLKYEDVFGELPEEEQPLEETSEYDMENDDVDDLMDEPEGSDLESTEVENHTEDEQVIELAPEVEPAEATLPEVDSQAQEADTETAQDVDMDTAHDVNTEIKQEVNKEGTQEADTESNKEADSEKAQNVETDATDKGTEDAIPEEAANSSPEEEKKKED